MIKYKMFQLQSPNPKYERNLNNTMEEINNFFSKHPAYKVINIEHVFSPENNNFGSSFCHICVWFSIETSMTK